MPFFITEKETEDWLGFETRAIPMPDGTQKPFTHFKLMWNAYDFLIICEKYTAKELVELAVLNSQEMGYSFDDSFPAVLSYLQRRARKVGGID